MEITARFENVNDREGKLPQNTVLIHTIWRVSRGFH